MKFTTKLLILGVVPVLSVILLHLIMANMGSHALKQEIQTHLQERAVHTMDKLDRMLFERSADMHLLAEELGINGTRLTDQSYVTQKLLSYRNNYKAYYYLSFYDANRLRTADTIGLGIGQPAISTRWVKTVFEKGNISLGEDIHFDPLLQKMVVCFAMPVKNKKGQLLGAVVAQMAAENLYLVLGGLEEEEAQIHVTLLDSEGKLLFSTDKRELIGEQVLPAVTPEHIARYVGEESFYTVTKEQGYLDFHGNGWTLLVHYPKKQALAAVTQLRIKALIALLIILVL